MTKVDYTIESFEQLMRTASYEKLNTIRLRFTSGIVNLNTHQYIDKNGDESTNTNSYNPDPEKN
jgi:hypothetical protein